MWELTEWNNGGSNTWYYHVNGQRFLVVEERGRCTVLYVSTPGSRPPENPVASERIAPGCLKYGAIEGLPAGGRWETGPLPRTYAYVMPDGRVYIISETTLTTSTGQTRTTCRILYTVQERPGASSPPTQRPGGRVIGGIGRVGNRVGNYLPVLQTILQILAIPSDPVAACHEAVNYLRGAVNECLDTIRFALKDLKDTRERLARIANSCPGMSAKCRKDLNDMFNWIANAIRRMEEIERETARLAERARRSVCQDEVYNNPSEDVIDRAATPEALAEMGGEADRLCDQCNDAFRTAGLWGDELTKFRKACACRQVEAAIRQGGPEGERNPITTGDYDARVPPN